MVLEIHSEYLPREYLSSFDLPIILFLWCRLMLFVFLDYHPISRSVLIRWTFSLGVLSPGLRPQAEMLSRLLFRQPVTTLFFYLVESSHGWNFDAQDSYRKCDFKVQALMNTINTSKSLVRRVILTC